MANLDIDTPQEFITEYSRFPELLGNEAIRTAFAKQEQRAVDAKARYTFFGRTALIAAFLSLSAVIYIVTLEHLLFEPPKFYRPSDTIWFQGLAFLSGIVGFAAQMLLLFSSTKKRWLNARFRAERLRSIKFLAFQAALCGGDAAVAPFTTRALALLAADTTDEDDATSARLCFEPEAALLRADGCLNADSEALRQLREAYGKLRVDRQANFAHSERQRITEERKLPASLSEITFWLGAGLAFADAILTFIELTEPALRAILHFATLEAFVISALLFVHERGRAYVMALQRYEGYREDMVRMSERLAHAHTAEEFQHCVRECESHALNELQLFCQEAEHSTYLI